MPPAVISLRATRKTNGCHRARCILGNVVLGLDYRPPRSEKGGAREETELGLGTKEQRISSQASRRFSHAVRELGLLLSCPLHSGNSSSRFSDTSTQDDGTHVVRSGLELQADKPPSCPFSPRGKLREAPGVPRTELQAESVEARLRGPAGQGRSGDRPQRCSCTIPAAATWWTSDPREVVAKATW